MFAIVNVGGHQYKVKKGDKITVNRVAGNQGDVVEFGEVILVDNDGNIEVGNPTTGKVATAKIVEHFKGEKVIIFKKKRRKGYRVRNGHRQLFTSLSVEAFDVTPSAPKKEKKAVAPKAASKKVAPKKEEAPQKAAALTETKVAVEPKVEKAPKAKKDDLKKIEGIGPKIASVLTDAGIVTFADLAASTPEKIREILDAAEGNFAAHDPGTWPQQADLAANGKWDELQKWQDELKGGKEVE